MAAAAVGSGVTGGALLLEPLSDGVVEVAVPGIAVLEFAGATTTGFVTELLEFVPLVCNVGASVAFRGAVVERAKLGAGDAAVDEGASVAAVAFTKRRQVTVSVSCRGLLRVPMSS